MNLKEITLNASTTVNNVPAHLFMHNLIVLCVHWWQFPASSTPLKITRTAQGETPEGSFYYGRISPFYTTKKKKHSLRNVLNVCEILQNELHVKGQ